MAGKDTIVVTDVILVDVFYGACNLGVELLFPFRQDGIVGDFSCEGMLEDIG